jgi:shikimate kinase
MQLSLIGMSGSGKSSWSIRLAEIGFRLYCCDDLIKVKLAPELTRSDGSMMELGEWMGFPYESRYKERESKYLTYENEVLTEIIEILESRRDQAEENVVIDTTGSVIYTREENLKRLRQCTKIVHFATPLEVQDQMLRSYLANQRPVLWRDFFSKEPNETFEDAMARCYPRLLISRERLYERYADVAIDYYLLNCESFGVFEFLKNIHV